VFSILRKFIRACSTFGRYGLILESDKEIYQELLEPLFKDLKVGDDTSHDLHDTNSNSMNPKKEKIKLDYE
jgi:hypothetical protein